MYVKNQDHAPPLIQQILGLPLHFVVGPKVLKVSHKLFKTYNMHRPYLNYLLTYILLRTAPFITTTIIITRFKRKSLTFTGHTCNPKPCTVQLKNKMSAEQCLHFFPLFVT